MRHRVPAECGKLRPVLRRELPLGISEVAGRIVERKMAVFSDSEQRDVEAGGWQQRGIARAFCFLIRRFADDLIEYHRGDADRNMCSRR